MKRKAEIDQKLENPSPSKRGIIFNPGIDAGSSIQTRDEQLKKVREFLTKNHFKLGSWLIRESSQEGFVTVSKLVRNKKKDLDYTNVRYAYVNGAWMAWNKELSPETGKLLERPDGLNAVDKMNIGSKCKELVDLILSKTIEKTIQGMPTQVPLYKQELWILPEPHRGQLTQREDIIEYGINQEEYSDAISHVVMGESNLIYNDPMIDLGKLYYHINALSKAISAEDLNLDPCAQQCLIELKELVLKKSIEEWKLALETPYSAMTQDNLLYVCLVEWMEKPGFMNDVGSYESLQCPVLMQIMLTKDLEPMVINDSGRVESKASLLERNSDISLCALTRKPILHNPNVIRGYAELAEKTMNAFKVLVTNILWPRVLAQVSSSSSQPSALSQLSIFVARVKEKEEITLSNPETLASTYIEVKQDAEVPEEKRARYA